MLQTRWTRQLRLQKRLPIFSSRSWVCHEFAGITWALDGLCARYFCCSIEKLYMQYCCVFLIAMPLSLPEISHAHCRSHGESLDRVKATARFCHASALLLFVGLLTWRTIRLRDLISDKGQELGARLSLWGSFPEVVEHQLFYAFRGPDSRCVIELPAVPSFCS